MGRHHNEAAKYDVKKPVVVTGLSRLPPNLDALKVPVIVYTTTVASVTDQSDVVLAPTSTDGSVYGGPVNQPLTFVTSNVDDFYSFEGDFVAVFLTGANAGQPSIPISGYIGATMTLSLASSATNPIAVDDVISIQMNTTWWRNDCEETWVRVNPKDHKNIIVVTRQDLFGESAGTGFIASIIMYSKDGGKTWNQSNYVMSRDQGATTFHAADNFSSSSNIKVDFDPQGNAYICSVAFNQIPYFVDGMEITDFLEGDIFAKSTDGGATWTKLYPVEEDDGLSHFLDQPQIVADPYRKNRLYISTADDLTMIGGTTANVFVQTSFDAGENWTDPFLYVMAAPATENEGVNALSPSMTVLNDSTNTLMVAASSFPYTDSFSANATETIYLSRSVDDGKNWTQQTIVPTFSFIQGITIDPLNLNQGYPEIGSFSIPTITAAPKSKDVYLVYPGVANNGLPNAYASSMLMMSKDSGVTWTTPIPVSKTGQQTFLGTVAVADNGIVAVFFYDFRNAKAGSNYLSTDAWITLWTKDLKFIRELRLTQESFNLYNAIQRDNSYTIGPGFPTYLGYYLGDYCNITSHGNDFSVAYSITNDTYGTNPPLPVPPSAIPGNGFVYDPIPRNKVVYQKIKHSK
jgi:hypothetical protein